MIELRDMTEKEYTSFRKQSLEDYKKDKMRANGYTEEEALQISKDSFLHFLPEGFYSKDNFLLMLEDEKNNIVGHLWYCIQGAENNRKSYICDILIYEEFRGKGFGKSSMLALEEHVKKKGILHIGLHVFGFNDIAISLYRSLGYEVTDLNMEKKL